MMTDGEVASDRPRRLLHRATGDAITATVVDPASLCADDQRRGLQRIAATLDAVPYVTMCNLANFNAAMRGELLDLIEVGLLGRWWPYSRLCRRDGVPRRVRDRDREGAQTAAAMMDGPH